MQTNALLPMLQVTTFCSVSRWPQFCLWADYHTFVCEQMTTLLSVSRRPHFFMWADEHIYICVQITTLSSVWHVNGARRLSSLWESYLTIFCKVQWGDLTSTHHLYLLRSTRQHDFKRAHVHELVEATDSAFPQYFNQPAAAGGQEMLEWSLYSGAKPGHCIYKKKL